MRFRHPDGSTVHLAYCTNVHPTDDLDALLRQVQEFGGGVRARLGVDRLGLGLWLPAPVASRLATAGEAQALRAELDRSGLEVVTLNAFPYDRFHARRVKKDVYVPDWSEPERLQYTMDCATVLAALLPDDVNRGSISTLPLAWHDTWDERHQQAATKNLEELASGLAGLEAQTGRVIRVGLEPEPGCVIETTTQALESFDAATQPRGVAAVDLNRIGVCVDTCHLAVAFEDAAEAVPALGSADIPVVKAQVSAALQVDQPGQDAVRAALEDYTEDRYLHQVREQCGNHHAAVAARDDLPDALIGPRALAGTGPWRVHFHVPLHEAPMAPLGSTTEHLRDSLAALVGGPHPVTDHLEVETYTWSVLPAAHRPATTDTLVDGLAAELTWVTDHLTTLGLEPL